MERTTRLTVLVSTLCACATHAWLAHTERGLLVATFIAFAGVLAVARFSFATAVAFVAASAYAVPALLTAAFQRADYHHLGVWLAALAGLVVAQADVSRWHFPRRWRWPLAGWALVLAVSWPVVAAREVNFSLVAAESYGGTNGISQLSPPVAAAYVVVFALTPLLGLLFLDLLFAKFHGDVRRCARVVGAPFVVGVAASALVGIYQRTVDLEFLNPPLWSNLLRAGGLMNDANTFGTGAAIWAPLSVVVVWAAGYRTRWAVASYLLLACGMWSAGSRTALLAFTAGSIGVGIALLKRRGLWQPKMGRVLALAGAAAIVLVVAVVPREFEGGNAFKRAFDRIPRLDSGDIRRFVVEDLWLRFGYGQAAIDIVRDHPLAGVGGGAFHVVAPDYIYRRTQRALAADNAQNWWRQQLAESGIVGALPALWASVLVLLLLRGPMDGDPPGTVTVLRATIVGVGVASLFGVPTQHPATWLSFATAVYLLIAQVRTGDDDTVPARSRSPWGVGMALALLVASALLITGLGDLRPPNRALETVAPYAEGLTAVEGTSDFGEFRWAGTSALAVMPVHGQWLQLTMWAPYADVARRNISVAVRMNERLVLQHAFNEPEAGSYFIAVPPGVDAVTLRVQITGRVASQRAIQVATAWRGQVPRGVAEGRVIR